MLPFDFENGRWLRLDKEQREARHVDFDFDKLCETAVACVEGAKKHTRCSKYEGHYNRAFRLELDNGVSIIARIPFKVAGPARYTTSSEVATMEYVRQFTSIPVPEIYAWSDDASNPMGTEYIIMEYVGEARLQEKWPGMSPRARGAIVEDLARMAAEMASLRFPAYGSLYFADASTDKTNTMSVSARFCIGPHCGPRYWGVVPGDERNYARRFPNRGPWRTHAEYCQGLLDVGISRIPSTTPDGRPELMGTVESRLEQASHITEIVQSLTQHKPIIDISRPALFHYDINKHNIFVSDDDPPVVTSIIDWQSNSIQPIRSYAYTGTNLLEYPPDCDPDSPTLNPGQRQMIQQVQGHRHAWRSRLQRGAPDLIQSRELHSDFVLSFKYASTVWNEATVVVEEHLINMAERWSVPLGLPGTCPHKASDDREEQRLHQQRLEYWKTIQNDRASLIRILRARPDGYVGSDWWEGSLARHKQLYAEVLSKSVKEDEATRKVRISLWPFDAPTA